MGEIENIKKILREMEHYKRAASLIILDIETACPEQGMDDEGETAAFLENKGYLLGRSEEFTDIVLKLHERRDELSEWEASLSDFLYRRYLKEKNITPEKAYEFSLIEKNAYADWRKAYDGNDYSLFKDSLNKVIKEKRERCALRILTPEEKTSVSGDYDLLLDDMEEGFRVKTLDGIFDNCLTALTDLKDRIIKSRKKIRTDFLHRKVSDDDQRKVAEYIADILKYNGKRGELIIAKHALTEGISKNNVRITTYFEPVLFSSNLYSVLHESGHALFELLQPEENFEWFIKDRKSQGMHESVARFYENVIGRSEGFIHFIYPMLSSLLPDVLSDVSERELYEGVNYVEPALIRTDADEVTYSLHIIIRYELEKKLISGELSVDDLPEAWDDMYEKYLGIRPGNVREGVLQDVHWTSDFGYFPSYLLGNIYSAMYYKCMNDEFDVDTALREGNIGKVTGWMKERVFKKADRLTPPEWIKEITGRDLTEEDYISYLNDKYSEIYGI